MPGDRRMAQNIYVGEVGFFKICSKCDRAKLLNEYNAKVRNYDGKRSYCRECQSDIQQSYARNNHEKLKNKNAKWRRNNPEKVKEIGKRAVISRKNRGYDIQYRKENAESLAKIAKLWWRNNPHKRKQYNDKQVSTGQGKLEAAIRACVRSEIRFGSKGGRRTFDLLGYTPFELRKHLEKQFTEGMNWENYGRGGWHVDHIIPLSLFSYETPDDEDFKAAWSLKNLQPMWQRDNLSKADKIILKDAFGGIFSA